MKALLYTLGLTLIAHSISSTAHAALHLDFPTTSVTTQPSGYIGGWFGDPVSFDEWVGSSATDAVMNDGVLETVSTASTFRGAAIVFDASSFDGAGTYTLNFDVTDYDQGAASNTGNVNIWSGSGYDTGSSALIVDTELGTLRTTGSATSTELGSLVVTSTGNNQSIAFTYDGTSVVSFFFGATSGASPHAEANYANINVTGLQVIPEPGSYALIFGFATVSVVFGRRRRS